MINSIAFDLENAKTGIGVFATQELIVDRGSQELTNPHRVEFYALILVTEGSGYHYIDGKLYHCRPGTLLVLSPHQVHYFERDFDWQGIVITFQDSELFPIDDLGPNYSIIKSIRSVDYMNDMIHTLGQEFEMLREEFLTPNDTITLGLQRNLLQNILYKIFFRCSYSTIEPPKSREVRDFQFFNDAVELNFTQKHNATEYLVGLQLSSKRLNSVCKKVKGITAKQVIDARILLEAKRLIGYTNIPISEIAISLGFNEPTNLAKFFRKHTDISPTEFRNMSKPFLPKSK